MRTAQTRSVQENTLITVEGNTVILENSYSPEAPLFSPQPVESWRYIYVKRAIDVVCSLLMLLAFAIPGVLIAAAILLTSKGPIFYREQRIGRDGRLFRIWKFRSMRKNAAQLTKIANAESTGNVLEWRMRKHLKDPRVTAVGGFLRRWSLDELPQIVNVLRGEMSLIGPRPIVPSETVYYGDLFSYYLAATPGLSGLWQVSGRSGVDYDRRVVLDAFYVQSWSLRSDFDILFRTIPAVLGRIGAL